MELAYNQRSMYRFSLETLSHFFCFGKSNAVPIAIAVRSESPQGCEYMGAGVVVCHTIKWAFS